MAPETKHGKKGHEKTSGRRMINKWDSTRKNIRQKIQGAQNLEGNRETHGRVQSMGPKHVGDKLQGQVLCALAPSGSSVSQPCSCEQLVSRKRFSLSKPETNVGRSFCASATGERLWLSVFAKHHGICRMQIQIVTSQH